MRKASGSIPDISTFALFFFKQRKWHLFGLDRDLNPGPLAPEARIIPLDHQAMHSQPSGTPIKEERTPGHTEDKPLAQKNGRTIKNDLPRVRLELTAFRLWDWRAAYCATEAWVEAGETNICFHTQRSHTMSPLFLSFLSETISKMHLQSAAIRKNVQCTVN